MFAYNNLGADESSETVAPEEGNGENDIETQDEDISNMFRIPPEIRAKIFKKLDQKSLHQLRCTHPILKNLVDHYLGLDVHITAYTNDTVTVGFIRRQEELSRRFDFYGSVALRNVRVGFLNSEIQWFQDLELEDRFDALFMYPQHLKNIQFEGTIEVYFLQKILQNCCNLESFNVAIGSFFVGAGDFSIFPGLKNKDLSEEDAKKLLYKIHLPKLQCLRLFVEDVPHVSLTDRYTHVTLSILRTTWSDCLTKLILQLWVTNEYSFLSMSWVLAMFLKVHPTLRNIFLGFVYRNGYHSFLDEDKLLDSEREGLDELQKELSTISKSIKAKKFGFASKCIHLPFWECLLSQQSNLQHLSLTIDKKVGSEWENLFQNSVQTIRQLFIRGEFTVPFDCFSLVPCSVLKDLCLHNTNEFVSLHNPLVKNISYMPSNLKSLILFNTIIPTEEMLQMLEKLESLETLVLFKTGRGTGNGVDIRCLKQVLQMRTLVSVLIVRFIATTRQDAKAILDMLQMQDDEEDEPCSIPVVGALRNFRAPTINNRAAAVDSWDTTTSEEDSSEDSSNSSSNHSHSASNTNVGCSYEFSDAAPNENSLENIQLIAEDSEDDDASSVPNEDNSEDLQTIVRRRPSPTTTHVHIFHSTAPPEVEDAADIPNAQSDSDYGSDNENDNNDNANNRRQNILERLQMHDQPLANIFAMENVAEFNVNADGNELQVIFEGGVDIEDIDIHDIVQIPEVQVHFVLDTVLDIMPPDLKLSPWTRKEDENGNVVFNLRLNMETD